MNKSIWVTMASTLCLASALWAKPFDESMTYDSLLVAHPINKTLATPAQAMPLDDYIISLSSATQVNLIADVTELSNDEWVQPFVTDKSVPNRNAVPFWAAFAQFERTRAVSDWRYDENTYLLWKQPERNEAVRLILAEQGQRATGALPAEFELHKELTQLIQQRTKWDGEPLPTVSSMVNLPLREVPGKLREQLKSLARFAVLNDERWFDAIFDEASWDNATIGFTKTRYVGANGKRTPNFLVRFPEVEGFAPVYTNSGELELANEAENAVNSPFAVALVKDGTDGALPTAQPRVGLSSSELNSDAALKSAVSLEVKRVSLQDVVAKIAAQSQLTLQVAADVAAKNLLVTARIQDMSSGDAMGALARTFDLYWIKSAEGNYELKALDLTPLQTLIRRAPNGRFATSNREWDNGLWRIKLSQSLQSAVWTVAQARGLKSSQTLAFSELPQDVADNVRALFRDMAANQLLASYRYAHNYIGDDSTLQLQLRSPLDGGRWQVSYLTPDQRVLIASTGVRPDPTLQASQKGRLVQEREQKMRARIEQEMEQP